MKFFQFVEGLESRFSYEYLQDEFIEWMFKHYRYGTRPGEERNLKRLFKLLWDMNIQPQLGRTGKLILRDRRGKEIEWDFWNDNEEYDEREDEHPGIDYGYGDNKPIKAKELKYFLKRKGLDTNPRKERKAPKSRPELPFGKGVPQAKSKDMLFVKVSSHRAREKMFDALGYKPQGYWSHKRGGSAATGFYAVSSNDFQKLKGIKGITKARGPYDDLMQTWSHK